MLMHEFRFEGALLLMIAFILPGHSPLQHRFTLSLLREALPEAAPVFIEEEHDAAVIMNRTLSGEGARQSPFFLTLYAGEGLTAGIRDVLAQELNTRSSAVPGLILEPAHSSKSAMTNHRRTAPRGPVVWRTEVVMNKAGGFSEWSWLPFQHYILLEKQFQLARICGSWPTRSTDTFIPNSVSAPGWRKEKEEWALISPLLHALQPGSGFTDGSVRQAAHPLITVVTCCYNDGLYLPWSVRSLLAQSFAAWELIIVDDGSDDATRRQISQLPRDPRIKTVRLAKNYGKSYAMNKALQISRGVWLLELDADDWLSPRCLETLVSKAELSPDAGVLYGDHHEWVERTNKQLVYQGIRRAGPRLSSNRLLADGLPVAPRMIHAEKLRQLSGWNTEAPFGGRFYEDIELLCRMSKHCEMAYIAEPMYHRRLRQSSITHRHPDHYKIWRSLVEPDQ